MPFLEVEGDLASDMVAVGQTVGSARTAGPIVGSPTVATAPACGTSRSRATAPACGTLWSPGGRGSAGTLGIRP